MAPNPTHPPDIHGTAIRLLANSAGSWRTKRAVHGMAPPDLTDGRRLGSITLPVRGLRLAPASRGGRSSAGGCSLERPRGLETRPNSPRREEAVRIRVPPSVTPRQSTFRPRRIAPRLRRSDLPAAPRAASHRSAPPPLRVPRGRRPRPVPSTGFRSSEDRPRRFPRGRSGNPAGGPAPAPRLSTPPPRPPAPAPPVRVRLRRQGSFAPPPPRPGRPATSSLDPARGHPPRPPRSALKGRARPAAAHPASAGGRAVVGRRTGFRPGERGTPEGASTPRSPESKTVVLGHWVRAGGSSNGGAATKNVERSGRAMKTELKHSGEIDVTETAVRCGFKMRVVLSRRLWDFIEGPPGRLPRPSGD